jgi:hypothetical protein
VCGEIIKMGEVRNAYLIGHPERKRLLGKYRRRWGIILK